MDETTVMVVLKNSRKARKQTTCYPCQRRKVKCDRGLPCAVCVARGHSFLCSYGRPSETFKVAPSLRSGLEDNSQSGGQQSLPGPDSQLSALRSQLNHLHQELHEARKRHKQCEEAEDQVRRLQARCREYEDVHVSLRAGDWSALARINGTARGDSDTSSITPESSGHSQDAGSRDGEGFDFSAETSQITNVLTDPSTLHDSKLNPVSSAHPRDPILRTATASEVQVMDSPAEGTSCIQQSQTFFEQRGNMPDSTGTCCLPLVTSRVNIPYLFEGVPKCTPQPSMPNPIDYGLVLHQAVSGNMQQNQRKPSSTARENHRDNSVLHRSVRPRPPLIQRDQRERSDQVLHVPPFIEDSNTILSNPVLVASDTSSDIALAQISLVPPMMSSQDLEFMERNYADYWAGLVVEAQQSTLLAG